MVLVADGQALCLEENARLAVVGHAQRAVRSHQRLEQLPLAVRHFCMMPLEGLGENKRIA